MNPMVTAYIYTYKLIPTCRLVHASLNLFFPDREVQEPWELIDAPIFIAITSWIWVPNT